MNVNKKPMNMPDILAAIYQALAQALSPPTYALPDWLRAPGRDWPLFEPAARLAARQADPRWGRAIESLADVKAASPARLRAEYDALFVGQGRPKIWLYESYHLNGRVPGPATFRVKSLYEQAGLESGSAELPDHAALELAFLAYLCDMEAQSGESDWRTARRLFIKNHAGRWLPNVGRALMDCEYPAWRAVGHVLNASLARKPVRHPKPLQVLRPALADGAACNLCGFCVQTCPTRALGIREDDATTALWLNADLCVGCERCVRVCPSEALALEGAKSPSNLVLLRQSPRAACPHCGAFTVSQTEIETISAQLGEHPAWLDYCLDCRPLFMEMNR